MSYSKDDLFNSIANKLVEKDASEALPSDLNDFYDQEVPALISDLQARGKVYLPSIENIPDGIFAPLVAVLALRLTVGTNPDVREVQIAEDRLKAAARPIAAQTLLTTDRVLRRGARPIYNPTTGQ